MKILALIRWKNVLMIGFFQLLAYFFLFTGLKTELDFLNILILVFSTMFMAAAGYVINDYQDVKIDEINKPEKVIVNRYISGRRTLLLYFLLNTLSLLLVFNFGKNVLLLTFGLQIWLWFYSTTLKSKLYFGNLSVAIITSFSILLVYLSFKKVDYQWMLFYMFFSFLTNLLREIIKDIEDIEGDEKYGCVTIPIKFGIYYSKQISIYLIYLILIFLLVAIWLINLKSDFIFRTIIFSLYQLIFIGIPLLLISIKMDKLTSPEEFHSISSKLKRIMLLGILSMPIYLLKF